MGIFQRVLIFANQNCVKAVKFNPTPRIIFRTVNCGYLDFFLVRCESFIPLVGLRVPRATHFIIQLNRTLFEILTIKSRRNEFEICRSCSSSRLIFLFSSISSSPRKGILVSSLYFILLSGWNGKDQSWKIYVSARKHEGFNMLTSKPPEAADHKSDMRLPMSSSVFSLRFRGCND